MPLESSHNALKVACPAWQIAALLVILIAAPLWELHLVNGIMPITYNDLLPRLVGSRAALQGKDPYSPEVTKEIQRAYYGRPLAQILGGQNIDPQTFDYPAYLVIFLAPLARSSAPAATLIFLCLAVPLLLVSFFLCDRFISGDSHPGKSALVALVALCSWPVMWGLRLQQLTLPVAALIFIACYLLAREQDIFAGILLALTMIKPQLVLPLLAWLLVWAFGRRLWGFFASFALSFLLMLLCAYKVVPGWFGHWIHQVRGYNGQATLLLVSVFGHSLGLILTIALLAYCGFFLWRLRDCSPCSPEFCTAVSLALTASLAITLTRPPLIYNQLLLLPACLVLLQNRQQKFYAALGRTISLALLVWGYASVLIAVLIDRIFGPRDLVFLLPFQNSIFPIIVAITLCLGLKRGPETRAAENDAY